MQDSNYVILVDENGQPYIAHSIFGRLKSGAGKVASAAKTAGGKVSSGVGRGARTAHKYIEKIGEGAKARYFYTQDELKAYYDQARGAVGRAAEKSRTAASAVTKRGRDALSAAGTKARVALDQGKDRAGYDERDRRDQARERLGGRVDTSTPEGRQAWQEFEKAQAEYRQTPLGKLEYAKDRASELMSESSRTAKEFGSDIKSRSERMREEFRDKASEAADKVKETTASLKDKASEAADKAKETAGKAVDKAKDWVNDLGSFFSNLPNTVKNSAEARSAKKILEKMADGEFVPTDEQSEAISWLINHGNKTWEN